jgi:hypothetical protein
MVVQRLVIILLLLVLPGAASAANGYFQIVNDKMYFPDGSFMSTAPLDGKSILNGAGPPAANNIANIGDFYLDTANSMLYGPYSGSWGAGTLLKGPKGDPGSQGIQGLQGAKGDAGASPFTLNGTSAVYTAGAVGVGANPPAAAAALDVSSTTKGFLPPRLTTAQRDAISAPPAGLTVYNTTTGRLNFHNGSTWNALALLQQDQLGQTVGTSSFNTGPYYYTGYVAPRSGTISSVDIRVNSTGTFRLLVKDQNSRATLRSGTDVVVSKTGLVTVSFAPVSILAGEVLGFYYTGLTTFASGNGTTWYGIAETPASSSLNTQLSISAAVTSIY